MLHVQNPDLVRSRMGGHDPHAHHTHEVTVALRAERRAKWVRVWRWFASLGQSSWPNVGAVRSSASSAPENDMGDRTPGTPSGAICMPRATT
jgi:hypothetical protein